MSLKPRSLRRYRDVALLLLKYGRSDAVRRAGLEEALDEGELEGEPASGEPEAEALAADLERLGPTFIKLGQLLSTRPDILPEPYLHALQRLQDRVEPFPFADVEDAFQGEIGVRLSKAFSEIDHEPLAAASLAQVHRAVMRDGRTVAVKVQRPGIRRQVAEDLEALGDIAEFLDQHAEQARRLQFRLVFEEFRHALMRELDYRNEARNLENVGANLAGFERILVPQPVADFSSSRVLTMEFIQGRNITRLGPLARLELKGAELAEELFRAYLKQIIVDGLFHADPHPGNVLLTGDDRLALIDLGMVARIAPRTRDNLLQLLMAVADGRTDDAVSLGIKIGERSDDFDEAGFSRQVTLLVGEQHDLAVGQIEVGRVMLQVTRISGRCGLRLPVELALLGKTLLNLDQVAWLLDPDFNPNAAIRRHAPALIQDSLQRDLAPGNAFTSLLEMKDFVAEMPGRVNRIMDAVANNELSVHVRTIDEGRLLAGMHKIANRITMGLVLSALIIGAALLMKVETPFRILGYPGLAIVCFALAASGGFVLLIRILRDEF